jgi:hypothetical protein
LNLSQRKSANSAGLVIKNNSRTAAESLFNSAQELCSVGDQMTFNNRAKILIHFAHHLATLAPDWTEQRVDDQIAGNSYVVD